ncbi:MAG: TetR/AcrR family transcriptional regulator [Chloroflexia bacterium]|nr:TetR/AcrR family transcriptional regulator [Chloroflexia bacterium]
MKQQKKYLGEGLKSISVRNIAEKAGYSYATLYNYFKDVKDLIFLCVKDFQDECKDYIREEVKQVAYGKARIKMILISIVKYFNQYPGIFELFYIETMSDISSNREATNLVVNFIEEQTKKDWETLISGGLLTEKTARLKIESVNYMIAGALLLYLNRRYPGSYNEFAEGIVRQIDFLID